MKNPKTILSNCKKKSNCFTSGNISGIAKCLRLCGFSVVPLKRLENDKGEVSFVPKGEWKGFREVPIPIELVPVYFEEAQGLAIACGYRCVVLDIDEPEKFEKLYPLEKLKAQCDFVVKTKDPGHYHFYFALPEEELLQKTRNFLKSYGFELKGRGSLTTFFVTSDYQYQIEKAEELKPLPEDLKAKLLDLVNSQKEIPKEIEEPKKDLPFEEASKLAQEILNLLEPYYFRGQRQNFVLYISGVFRKAGIPKEVALAEIETFCEERLDEETKMRLEAVKCTYSELKPDEAIAGISGLEEVLGVKEEDLLKLKALLRQKKLELEIEEAFEIFTAKELSQKDFPPPQWLIPSVLPEGLTILVGKPKVGKSSLALQLAVELAIKGKRVVYLALEDKPARLNQRLKKIGAENLINLYIACPKRPVRIGKGGWKHLKELTSKHSPDLLIIDPWVKIKPISPKKGVDPYAMDYEALEMIKELNQNILVIHHKRKTESEDPLDEILGTTGIAGAVDTILSLKRTRGASLGTLEIIPRDFEEKSLALSFDKGIWQVLGDAKEVIMAEEQRKILEAIKELGGEASIKQVANWLGKNYETIKTHILRMKEKGILETKERGTYTIKRDFSFVTNVTNVTDVTDVTFVTDVTDQKVTSVTPVTFGVTDSKASSILGSEEIGYKGYKGYTILKIKNSLLGVYEFCYKCGCDDWKIERTPKEIELLQGKLVFVRCNNCSFERVFELKDYEIIGAEVQ